MKKAFIIIVMLTITFCSGILFGVKLSSPSASGINESITTVQKSGKKITVSNWDTSGSTIRFTTSALGVGTAETTVPKTIIPEARSYIEDVNSINGMAGILVYDRSIDKFIGAEYMRRKENISFGGGGFVSLKGIIGTYVKAGSAF